MAWVHSLSPTSGLSTRNTRTNCREEPTCRKIAFRPDVIELRVRTRRQHKCCSNLRVESGHCVLAVSNPKPVGSSRAEEGPTNVRKMNSSQVACVRGRDLSQSKDHVIDQRQVANAKMARDREH